MRAVPWEDKAEQELSRLAPSGLRAIYTCLHFQIRAARGARHGPPNLRLEFEVARQAISPSLCASVRAVSWADKAEQELSRLAPYGLQLSADVCIFGAGLTDAPCTDTQSYV